jgi:hypothetical protein
MTAPDLEGALATAHMLLASIQVAAEPARGRIAFTMYADAETLISEARRGDPAAKAAVHEAILALVADAEPLPQALFDYLNDLLSDAGPSKRPGHGNYLRDDRIRHAVKAVAEYGFSRTRNPETDSPSACSIVRDVLLEYGVDMSEKSIEKIATY